MALARFLQVSDLHLGRPFAWLSAERREQRRRDQQRALEAAVGQAIERGAHAILLPGDLFDAAATDAGTLAFAVKAFAVHGCPPVFIAPGNHDPVAADNPAWNPRLLHARGAAWPEHVHVFTSPGWTAREVPRLAGVRMWGRAATAHVESAERPLDRGALAAGPGRGDGALEVAVFHGSREGRCPPAQAVTAPFSDEEVAASPFAYHAVGHYHAASRIEQAVVEGVASAGSRLAYAGSAVALDMGETGAHGALEVRIEHGRGLPFVEAEPVELDRRRVLVATADVSGCASADQVDRRLLKALDAAGAGDADLVNVTLAGRLPPGVRWAGPSADVRGRVFHLRVNAAEVRPDYDLDAYRAAEGKTTEERFAQELLRQLDAEADPGRRALVEHALVHGLDAFRLREVAPRWDEVTG